MAITKKIQEEIEIPNDVQIEIVNNTIKVKGPKGSVERKLARPKIKISKENNKLILTTTIAKPSKREKTIIGTFKSHIQNLIKGVTEGYVYKLKICSSHFPMNVSIEGNFVVIKNFIGEKIPRKAKILPNVNVKVEGDVIIVEGVDIENVAQTANRIEQTTAIKARDRRVFQDGCYIFYKAGKEIK